MVVVVVVVVRRARRGRRKVGGRAERGGDGCWNARAMLRANMLEMMCIWYLLCSMTFRTRMNIDLMPSI